ncbi:hypothetical protein [Methylobacter sp. YRD-M1]|uniref:hypothetical protein n=1 Tax=Methylobacter sp. YRD-M1 TaxID=2911520 RepID=UPI00227B1F1E|nr:hypothetical protein [Methylobacter sp. YRD-M1]WAK04602.1 hypothetical protein LZ558_22365 [Methylobacter sp. YRD-M1]
MLVQLVDKQRRAVSVVKTALLRIGITGRSVCVQADSWSYPHGDNERYSVFVLAPIGVDVEPYYVTGKTIVEAVRNMIASIKGRANSAKTDDQSEEAPF